MRPLEPGSELRESPFGERRIGERVSFLEGATDARPHGLGEMLQDVPRFVDLTAMDERGPATVLADRFAEPRPAVDDEEHRPVEVESALPESA